MTDNLRIWNVLSKTDPKHTKQFKRAGGFSGTAMKPIWVIKQMTELFGPAGTGWGMREPVFQTVNAGDEILVFCTVALWYNEGGLPMDGGSQGIVYGVGGDKVLGKNKYGPFTNDEAFKASYTDALSNAMKQIGVGADIHMGLFDDEKYVRETTREFAAEANADVERLAPKGAARGTDGELLSNRASKVAEAAKTWADNAITTINASNAMDAISWARAADAVPEGKKKSPLQWLEDNAPEQFVRVNTAYTNLTGEGLR